MVGDLFVCRGVRTPLRPRAGSSAGGHGLRTLDLNGVESGAGQTWMG
jgi:hypothetical protein